MNLIRSSTPQRARSGASPLIRLSAFQDEIERMFDLPFFGAEARSAAGFAPPLDLTQHGETLILRLELPGLKREDFQLSLHEDSLSVRGERRQEKQPEEKGALRNERSFGKFERTLTLPAPVDADRVSATYEDGILTVTLPKAEELKPRQIEIK